MENCRHVWLLDGNFYGEIWPSYIIVQFHGTLMGLHGISTYGGYFGLGRLGMTISQQEYCLIWMNFGMHLSEIEYNCIVSGHVSPQFITQWGWQGTHISI